MYNLFISILKLSISSIPVILLVLIMRFVLRKLPKKYTCLLWGIVFLKLVLSFTISVPKPIIPFSVNSSLPAIEHALEELSEFSPQTNGFFYAEDNPDFVQNNLDNAKNVALKISAPFAFSFFWFVGVLVLSTYMLIEVIQVHSKIKFAFREKENLFFCDLIQSPFVFGIIEPKIYLPTCLTDEDLQFIVAHEEIHIQRKDYLIKPLAFLILILHWFNPLVWVSFSLFTKDMEMSCDEMVITKLGDNCKGNYATSLLQFSCNKNVFNSARALFNESDTSKRVKNILAFNHPKKWGVILTAFIVVLTGCASFTSGEILSSSKDSLESIQAESQEIGDDFSENSSQQYNIRSKEGKEKLESLGLQMNQDGTLHVQDTSKSVDFGWPTAGGVRISRGFTGQYPAHNGLDVAGPQGTEIYAAAEGVVTKAVYSAQGYGNHVVITHANGMETLYGQCSALLVELGDIVDKGDLIAQMGNTGASTGNHLHFEIKNGDTCYDPYAYLE